MVSRVDWFWGGIDTCDRREVRRGCAVSKCVDILLKIAIFSFFFFF